MQKNPADSGHQKNSIRASRSFSRSQADRRGTVIVIVMICLLLISMIGASLMKLAWAQRNQTRWEQLRLQAEWLAESGIERAAAKLNRDPNYAQENWNPPADAVGAGRSATVRIQVEKDKAASNRRRVSVVAQFALDDVNRVRVSKRIDVDL